MILDTKTLILLSFIINLVNIFTMAIIWSQNHKFFLGLFFALMSMILQAAGFFFLLMRDVLPDTLSIVLANSLLIIGAMLMLIGLNQFFNKKRKYILNFILIAIFIFLQCYFRFVQPDLIIRKIIFSAMLIIICIQIAWFLLRSVDTSYRKIAILLGIVSFSYVIVSIMRIIYLSVFQPQESSLFSPDAVDFLVLALYMILSIVFTMSFALLVNKRLLAEVQTQKEKYNKTFSASPYAIILSKFDDGEIIEVNEEFLKKTGYLSEDVIGKKSFSLNLWFAENDRDKILHELANNNEVHEKEMKFRNKKGDIVTGLLSANIIVIENEKYLLTSISDITELSLVRQKLHDMAMHDALTGLPNRILFYDRFKATISNGSHIDKKIAILCMDIDRFKAINDQYGHQAGDKVLAVIGERLQESLRSTDIVARFGGDEFSLFLQQIDNKSDVIRIMEKLEKEIAKPINLGENIVSLSCSFGITLFPDDGMDINVLIKKSDDAMYKAKGLGGNRYCFYNETICTAQQTI